MGCPGARVSRITWEKDSRGYTADHGPFWLTVRMRKGSGWAWSVRGPGTGTLDVTGVAESEQAAFDYVEACVSVAMGRHLEMEVARARAQVEDLVACVHGVYPSLLGVGWNEWRDKANAAILGGRWKAGAR